MPSKDVQLAPQTAYVELELRVTWRLRQKESKGLTETDEASGRWSERSRGLWSNLAFATAWMLERREEHVGQYKNVEQML